MNVFITIWNRFSWAIPLCEDFTKAGLTVILIDNASTYPPCIEWLKSCPYKVHFMEKNESAWAFFTTSLYKEYTDRYFMVSDSDQDISGLPSDWVDVLMKGLEETSDGVWKSGLSQEIEDLPKDNPYAQEIYNYEKNYWTNVNKDGYYKVWMDIGVAIYDRSRRNDDPIHDVVGENRSWYAAVRSPRPYVSRHLDWYLTPEKFREEDIYYLNGGDWARADTAHYGWLFNWEKKYKNK